MKLLLATILLTAPLLAWANPHEPFDPHEPNSEGAAMPSSRMLAHLSMSASTASTARSLKPFVPSTKRFKNVIMMIPDGCDESVQKMANFYKGADLQVDEMPSTAVTSHMANSMITGSAAAATAFSTGHKTTVRFLSVGPRTEDLLSFYDPHDMMPSYSPIATILEAAKYMDKGTGIISTSRVTHATPAAFASHIDDRGKDNDIMEHIVYNNVDVVMGGGRRHLLPGPGCANNVTGGKRTDCQNLQDILLDRGYTILEKKADLDKMKGTEEKVYGMFAMSHMQPDMDRKHFAPEEPSLAEMTQAALEVLSKKEKGFFMMVEGSQVDWAGHNNDPVYMMTDFIAFDDAVKVAVDFAKADGETLILAFPDHNTGGPKIGNYGKKYTDVSLERLRDPFLGMTMTANGITRFIPTVNATNQDVIDAVLEYWGINMTDTDVSDIYDYMDTAKQSLSYSIAKVVSERYTEIGWTTHGHNGETVPLWIYGDDVAATVIDNTDIAKMAAAAFGIELDTLTEELYLELDVPHEVDLVQTTNPVVKLSNGAVFPIGKDYMIDDTGNTISLPGVTVYAPVTGKVYVSNRALSFVKGHSYESKVVIHEALADDDEADDDDDKNTEAIVVGVVLGIIAFIEGLLLLFYVSKNKGVQTAQAPKSHTQEQSPLP